MHGRLDADGATDSTVDTRSPATRFGVSAALAIIVSLAGCWQSDQETFARKWESDRRHRIDGMRAATAQHARGIAVEGDALIAMLEDTTHESVFTHGPSGAPGPYVERSYFGPGGRFIYTNSAWAQDPEGREGDWWRVDGARLCILNQAMSRDPQCFTIARRPDGRVQYYVDDPGADSHGLLTKIPTSVVPGRLPPPVR